MKNKLTEAFRSRNKDSILFYSIDLAHYIGDANVPLHTSLNYDGQLTNQKGLHSLWESLVPEQEIRQYQLYSTHKAQYLSNPEQTIWDCIRRAHLLLPDVFGKEREVSKSFTDATKYIVQNRRGREVKSYSPEFTKAYAKALGNTVNMQLEHSANMIADFWYTAWVDAGRPDPSTFESLNKLDKKALKKQKKIWKKEELQAQGLLISTIPVTGNRPGSD
jgi:5-methylcytosine-specific restriction endonuclease McrA